MASTTSTASTASKKKLTLRTSHEDENRLDALRARRRLRLAQADGHGPPDRVSRSSLALHYLRLGMAQAEAAEPVAPEQAPVTPEQAPVTPEQAPAPAPDKH